MMNNDEAITNLCTYCGQSYDGEDDEGLCPSCMANTSLCEDCGDRCNDDDLTYIEDLDSYYCGDCIENHGSRCINCDRYYSSNYTDFGEYFSDTCICFDCMLQKIPSTYLATYLDRYYSKTTEEPTKFTVEKGKIWIIKKK